MDKVLSLFPSHAHPLTLASDPGDLLADESTLAALVERGFRIVAESDPIQLRWRVEQARPWSAERPLLVVTPGPVEALPYDLWQGGHRIALALHAYFPSLAYPVVRRLSPARRTLLSRAPIPRAVFGRQATQDYVLRHAFGTDVEALRESASLLVWLDAYHQQNDPLDRELAERLLSRLRGAPALAGWPLDELLRSPEAFAGFVRGQWSTYVGRQTGRTLAEDRAPYVVGFESDRSVQDVLPRLIRDRVLEPVAVDEPGRLPDWARPGVVGSGDDGRARRAQELLDVLGERLARYPASGLWADWQAIARAWAELTALRHAPRSRLESSIDAAVEALVDPLDSAFAEWLRVHYPALGGHKLPTPHHVQHVPHYLAYRRRQTGGRVALVVLDGLSLADWQVIGSAWRARHPDWHLEEDLLLAQIPTITPISRQALISGARPADFAETIGHNRAEAREWAAFWSREGIPAAACAHALVHLDRDDLPEAVADERIHCLCLVCPDLDDLVHGSTLGAAGGQAALVPWLAARSPRLEALLEGLLGRGYAVYLASDHGHVEAVGMGQLSEGLVVESRSGRARLYRDRLAAESARRTLPETLVWGDDGLLPDDLWALLPSGRGAFAPRGEIVETHGGISLEEVVVPLVRISREDP